MLKSINLSNEELEKITKRKFSEGNESNTYILNIDGKKKIVKIFKKAKNLPNKLIKINLIKDRLKKCDFVVQPEAILKNQGETIGYIMPKVNGKMFNLLDYSRMECIQVLKDLSAKLKRLHKLGIVVADFHQNFMIDEYGEIKLIDIDNFAIDDLYVDVENIYLQKYREKVQHFDENFDNYLLNLFTLSCLTRTYCPYLYALYRNEPNKLYFRDEEINNIIFNTFNLNKQYNEDLIIDKIKCKKDVKKIKRKLF